jgi:hypothetical protein
MMRSFGAVLGGFVAVVILSVATDAVLHAAGVFPALGVLMSDGLFLLATAYRTIYGIFGSYLTARLAPNRPMAHALAGGAAGTVIATIGAIVTWNQPQLGPHWYPVILIVLAIPSAWVGAKLYMSGGRDTWSSAKTNS